jgi:hypothetical protein
LNWDQLPFLVDYERVLFDACGITIGHGGFSFFMSILISNSSILVFYCVPFILDTIKRNINLLCYGGCRTA